MKKRVDIFTDGACRGNPGPGGWGALLRYNGSEKELYGAEAHTTNNRMELTAAIKAIESVTESCEIDLTTDSQYVQRGVNEWLEGWKAKGWRTSSKKPVKNADLWQELDALLQNHEIRWHWVKGHSGHAENEHADQLANRAIDEFLNERQL